MRKFFIIILAFAAVLFLCCAEFPDIEFPSWEGEEISSSSESSSSSEPGSSSSTESSSSAVSSSSELGSSSSAPSSSSAVSSSSEPGSSSSAESSSSAVPSSSSCDDVCGGKCYDKALQFCSPADNLVYPLCGASKYPTDTHFCLSGVRTEKCGGIPYEPWEFCLKSLIYDKCGNVADGAIYDPATEQCCGSNKYAIATQFCQASTNEVKSLCGGATFTAAEFCSGGEVLGKCGGTEEYSPATENCCGSSKYATATHFCDARDNKTYKHTLIGTQTWMAENLNYNASGSKCGNGSSLSDANTSTCETYGRLYNWATAMAIDASCNTNDLSTCGATVAAKHKGVCPTGWHLPSDAEWTTLTVFVGVSPGTKLKSTSGWDSNGNGTDEFGFSALPGGDGFDNGNFNTAAAGNIGYWWSATENDASTAWLRSMNYNNAYVGSGDLSKAEHLFSVRCVQD